MGVRKSFEICLYSLFISLVTCPRIISGAQDPMRDSQCFVKVSARHARYFELTNGRPFVPIGLNMIAPRGGSERDALACMQQWIENLSENRGNYIRLWLSHDFFDIEHERSGQYDPDKAKRIDA
ncbi:MAG: hypothetical protein ACYTEK_23390, partial [Planctomycetota bacterium]